MKQRKAYYSRKAGRIVAEGKRNVVEGRNNDTFINNPLLISVLRCRKIC